jgi:hypothetical protein
MARRLLDTIKADPARWLATVREMGRGKRHVLTSLICWGAENGN